MTIPVHGQGNQTLSPPLKLNNVLYAPNLIHNLLYVCQLTTDNFISIKFDPFDFSVKDLQTRTLMQQFNDLYFLTPQMLSKVKSHSANVDIPQKLWHQRVGHPGLPSLQSLKKSSFIICAKINKNMCQPCVFGKSVTYHSTLFMVTFGPHQFLVPVSPILYIIS